MTLLALFRRSSVVLLLPTMAAVQTREEQLASAMMAPYRQMGVRILAHLQLDEV